MAPPRLSLALLLLPLLAAGQQQRRVYASGSGLGMLSNNETVREIIALSGKEKPRVLYLGTATYDDPTPTAQQTGGFAAAGCEVTPLPLAVDAPAPAELRRRFQECDVVLVSGGNTLFARDRWVRLGVDKLLAEAMERGVVLSGGSAGAIVWFDGGHSDSMEPESFKNPPGPLLNPGASKESLAHAWAYIRVPGLGLLPSLLCPHYDMTGSNGVHRAESFTAMLLQHPGESAVGLDNWAALVVEGEDYHIVSRAGKGGSVGKDGEFRADRSGRPGAWLLSVGSDGALSRQLVPTTGKAADLLKSARFVAQDQMLPVARAFNPDDGLPAAWNRTWQGAQWWV